MSDHEKQLRERVELKHGPLSEIKPPTTAEEAAKLAREDPDKFDALWEAGKIGRAQLGGQEADDGE